MSLICALLFPGCKHHRPGVGVIATLTGGWGGGGGGGGGSGCRCDWVLVLFFSGLKVWQKLSAWRCRQIAKQVMLQSR